MASQFESGHEIPVTHQDAPGSQAKLPIQPVNDQLPTADGSYQKYRPAGKLEGKTALITGGDSGIGRAIAVLYAMEGCASTIVYLPAEQQDAEETKKLVEAYHGRIWLQRADLESAATCREVVDRAVKDMGGINILVNNHGFQMMKKTIAELPEEQWEHTFATNIHSFFYLSKYTMPHLRAGDTIINCASVNPYVGRPDLLDYTATKGAIVAFTRGLSNQVVSKGIRVNAVCPGPIWTPLVAATMDSDAQEQFTSLMGRPGQPSEVATCFVFLAAADSSFISGQCLHPNGGTVVNG